MKIFSLFKYSIPMYYIFSSFFFPSLAFASTDIGFCKLNSDGKIETPSETCLTSPEKYTIKIYEVGMCRTQPTPPTEGSAIGFSDCFSVFKNQNGQEIVVTQSSSDELLRSSLLAPPNAEYSHIYTVLSHTIKISGVFNFNSKFFAANGSNGTTCWTTDATTDNFPLPSSNLIECGTVKPDNSSVGEITTNITSFSGVEKFVMSGGAATAEVYEAYLTTSDLKLPKETTGVERLIGVSPFGESLSGGKGLEISFRLSRGAVIVPDFGILAGPPSSSVKVIEIGDR